MPYDPMKQARIEKRRQHVWKRYNEGVRVAELARFHDVVPRMILRDIALMREREKAEAS